MTLDDQIAHYRTIRARLWRTPPTRVILPSAPPPPPPKPVAPPPQPVARGPYAEWSIPMLPRLMRDVVLKVCRRTQTSWPDFVSKARHADIVRKRQRLVYAVYRAYRMDQNASGTTGHKMTLGRLAGLMQRDHTTIMHAVRCERARRGR